jgi:glycosyltransferase involved in cell wall biosynthesis
MTRRLLINGRFADRPITGVERYGHEIVRAIDQLAAEGHPSTQGWAIEFVRPTSATEAYPLQAITERRVGPFSGHAWEQFSLPKGVTRDAVLINLCNFSPLVSPRAITCVHDAHVWLTPENFSTPFRRFYEVMLPLVIARSAKWTTITRYSAEQLTRFGAARRAPDAIAGNGAEHAARMKDDAIRVDAATLPEAFVLALGSRSVNKNFALVERIAPQLAELGLSVVVAGGGNASVFGGGGNVQGAGGVIALGRVSDGDLALLYGQARAFLFPSYFEGFGVPPIEAMALGCPVVASNTSALPEVLGGAAILCDPDADDDWVAAVRRLSLDPAVREDFKARGLACAARHSWRRSALDYLELAREVADDARR